MARWEFKLPDIGEGVTEGEIVSWLIKAGDMVKEDQPMIEVMTDKATVTITSPKAGRVVETVGAPGTVVAVHSTLVVFELDGSVTAADDHRASPPGAGAHANGNASANGNGHGNGHGKSEPAATAVGDIKENLPGMGAPRSSGGGSAMSGGGAAGLASAYFNAKPLATPATRKLARDMEIDLRAVPPTGPQGRVTKVDVESFAKAPPQETRAQGVGTSPPGRAGTTTTTTTGTSAHAPVKITPPQGQGGAGAHGPLEERVPFAGVRRKIAQKMAQSVHTAAHFTFVEECDCTRIKELRARLKPSAEKQGVKLTFLPFIVKAVVAALKKRPVLNSALDESTNELVYRKYYNIGIAT